MGRMNNLLRLRSRSTIWQRCLQYSSASKTCRIGCASGFWGDTAVAADQLVRKGNIDFLVFDYLSEITMTLLKGAQAKQPNMGYTPDFVDTIGRNLSVIKEKDIRVVSNAGGVNPEACKAAMEAAAAKVGVDVDVAVVVGDDVMPIKESLGEIRSMDDGSPLSTEKVISMNAYVGAAPIVECLNAGAQFVITGRCADSSVVLAPLVHQFGWDMHDYDRLAAGSLAGHLIECGAQSTGGIFTDHHLVPDWWNIGFPIVDVEETGEFVITKPDGTGGLVSVPTVAEQLLYEIDDPARYRLPDVDCDFRHVKLEEIGENRVRVTGARGEPPSGKLKVFMTSQGNFRLTAVAGLIGPDCKGKGHRTAEAILTRVRFILKRMGIPDFTRVHVQVLGCEETYGDAAKPEAAASREGVLWLAAEHPDKRALGLLAREIAPAGTGMAPGLTGLVGGRPKVSQMARHASFLLDQNLLSLKIMDKSGTRDVKLVEPRLNNDSETAASVETEFISETTTLEPGSHLLRELAMTRSGDKRNSANIGVIARCPEYYPILKREVTAEAVGNYFKHLFPNGDPTGCVERFELPGVYALNFVLRNSLGGGGVASLRPDPQGKGMGQMLLDLKISV